MRLLSQLVDNSRAVTGFIQALDEVTTSHGTRCDLICEEVAARNCTYPAGGTWPPAIADRPRGVP